VATFDSDGARIETFAQILDALAVAQRAKPALGATWVTSPDSPAGSINAVMADRERLIQELFLAVWQALSPYNATGSRLDDILARSNAERQDATHGTVSAVLNINNNVTVEAGSLASVVGDPESVFKTLTTISNTTGSPANFTLEMRAIEPGSRPVAPAGTLTVIDTPVAGWNSITNALTSKQGLDIEEDPQYVARWSETLPAAGSTNIDAIVAGVRQVSGVTFASGQTNRTFNTDADGVPGKAFEVVVQGGTDDAVAQAIWGNQPAGILSVGTASGTAVDLAGVSQTVGFARPSGVPIFVTDVVLFDSSGNDVTLTAGIKSLFVLAATKAFALGSTVSEAKLAQVWLTLDGIADATFTFNIGASALERLALNFRQIATFSDANVTT